MLNNYKLNVKTHIFVNLNYTNQLKRLTALGLLFIFLFNLGGYLLLFQYFIYRSDSAINQRIRHNNYKRTELVQMKIPRSNSTRPFPWKANRFPLEPTDCT